MELRPHAEALTPSRIQGEDNVTTRSKFRAFGLLACLALASGYSGAIAKTEGRPCAELKPIDPDNDGTVDMSEAKKAALALFGKLDTDKEGTLTLKELQDRLSGNEFKAADTDNDNTLSKEEYLALVESRFKAADKNGEGTVDCDEIKSSEGEALMRLLK
jgi:hypothetical protein